MNFIGPYIDLFGFSIFICEIVIILKAKLTSQSVEFCIQIKAVKIIKFWLS